MQGMTEDERTPDPRLQDDEAELLRRLADGDIAAFDVLYTWYAPGLWRYAARVVRSSELAQDVLHDVFFDLWRRRQELEIQGSVRGYLLRAIKLRAIDTVRHQAVVDRSAPQYRDDLLASRTGAQLAASPQLALEASDLRAAVAAAFHALSEQQREVLLLRWKHQLTHAEIAKILGISTEAAKKTGPANPSDVTTAARAIRGHMIHRRLE
jgi:RNA polymerase sigma-70 factor (ECF subfamily)